MVVLVVFFSAGRYLNSYYTAALSPIIAVLVALGLREWWLTKSNSWAWRTGAAVAVVGTVGLACELVPPWAGLNRILVDVVLALAVVALATVVLRHGDAPRSRRRGLIIGAVVLAIGFVPAATVADVTVAALGPFATPYQLPATNYQTQGIAEQFQARHTPFERLVDSFPEHELVGLYYTSSSVAGDVMMTGHELLPIGGFSGGAPEPTVSRIKQLAPQVPLVLVPLNASADPRVAWIIHHCAKMYAPIDQGRGLIYQNYRCAFAETRHHPVGSSGSSSSGSPQPSSS